MSTRTADIARPGAARSLRAAAQGFDARAVTDGLRGLARDLRRLRTRSAILAAHDALLFVLAHPPDARVRRHAEACLHALCRHVSAATGRSAKLAGQLANSGLTGTVVEADFSYPVACWLAQSFPGQVELGGLEADAALTQLVIRNGLLPIEHERLEREHHPLLTWLRRLGAAHPTAQLRALLGLIASATDDERMREYVFASLGVVTRWRLGPSAPSLSRARSLPRSIFHGRDWRRDVALRAWLRRPLPPPAALDARQRRRLLDAARGVLACLRRETDPVTYADGRGVTLFRLERGVDVALFPMRRPYRLGLESYVGYLAFRNGIPAGYGGGWVFGYRCKIGINVLPFMRGGESAFLLAQLMRVYARHYGPRVFFVEPYQIGLGNPEGIRSGAFWFYYRLGFRPVQADLARLAAEEFRTLAASRGQRSPVAVLRVLAQADLRWCPPGGERLPLPDPYVINRAVAAGIASAFGGDRRLAQRRTRAHTAQVFRGMAPAAARGRIHRAFGPLLAMLPGAEGWRASERRALLALWQAKLGGEERDYNHALIGHRTLLRTLLSLAGDAVAHAPVTP